jgi:DNA-directed RNA polymerase specialized sigma24 family protein
VPARLAAHVHRERARVDPAEDVARVATAYRDLLLRSHRFRLRWEDLEDCYSQATLELVQRARRGEGFASRRHIAHALEQRFVSRIRDRRRALAGRSPITAALEDAERFGADAQRSLDVVDRRAQTELLVLLREELRQIGELSAHLSADQRLVLASQLESGVDAEEFCASHDWSVEKYRKVAQRARSRLRALLEADDAAVPSQRVRRS